MIRQVTGVNGLKGISTLELWKRQIKTGETGRAKAERINRWLNKKVNEYKANNKALTHEIIQGLIIEAIKILKIKNVSSTKDRKWWKSFIKKHNLNEIKVYDS